MTVGIVGFGCYIPKFRIDRMEIYNAFKAPGEKEVTGNNAVNGKDEDSLTMASEAASNAVFQANISPEELNGLYIGTTSPPYNEQPMCNYLALYLKMPVDSSIMDLAHSTRMGTAGLMAALDGIQSGRVKNALVIGTDTRHAIVGSDLESNLGNGAGALVLGRENTLADIEALYSYSDLFVDRWRGKEDLWVRGYDYRYTRNLGYSTHILKAVEGLLKKMKRPLADFNHVVLHQIDTRMGKTLAKALGLTKEQTALAGRLVTDIGDCGAAHVFLGLNAVLEQAKPGERILMVSYGNGSSDAISLRVNEAIVDKRRRYPKRGRGPLYSQYLASTSQLRYTDFLQNIGYLQRLDKNLMSLSVPTVSPFIQRSYPDFLQLIAAKCRHCGYVNFPPTQRKICIRCGKTEFHPHQMDRTGKILTYTINYYMPAPLEYPLPLITAEMDDGESRFVGQGTEWDLDKVAIGSPTELVLRILDKSRGATVYAYRFRPL